MSHETRRGGDALGASQRVYLGVLQDLEQHRIVPGQRLIETELAAQFGVGRNAVREAMQRLTVRGVVDLSPNKSASIRKLDLKEAVEVLEVAAAMTAMAAHIAAREYDTGRDAEAFDLAMRNLAESEESKVPSDFSRARRRFYRTLLQIGTNRELQRLFPAIGMHIIYSQYQSHQLQQIRFADYRAIYDGVRAKDESAAAEAGRTHVEHVRDVVVRTETERLQGRR